MQGYLRQCKISEKRSGSYWEAQQWKKFSSTSKDVDDIKEANTELPFPYTSLDQLGTLRLILLEESNQNR